MITREEAKEKIEITKRETYPYNITDNVDELIDVIFDQFETQLSSTCESCTFCNHYSADGYECLKLTCTDDYGDEDFFEVEKDFYCNKYTSKDIK